MKLYVGNMPFEVTEEELRTVFAPFGTIESVSIIKDKISGKSKGFGFVEMSSKDEGKAAIDAMHNKEFKGRALTVNEARPLEKRDPRGGFGGGKGGFGRDRDNYGGFGKRGFGGNRGGFGEGGGRGQRRGGGRGR